LTRGLRGPFVLVTHEPVPGRTLEGGWGMNHRGAGSELGATAVEYAVMLAGIAAIIMGTIFALGVKTDGLFENLRMLWP
jgi:Flp pilus assembly pilin Flp